jgi:hypothetical protein
VIEGTKSATRSNLRKGGNPALVGSLAVFQGGSKKEVKPASFNEHLFRSGGLPKIFGVARLQGAA